MIEFVSRQAKENDLSNKILSLFHKRAWPPLYITKDGHATHQALSINTDTAPCVIFCFRVFLREPDQMLKAADQLSPWSSSMMLSIVFPKSLINILDNWVRCQIAYLFSKDFKNCNYFMFAWLFFTKVFMLKFKYLFILYCTLRSILLKTDFSERFINWLII